MEHVSDAAPVVPYRTIQRKRDGLELEPAELEAFFGGYGAGELPDYQMAALLMAVFFRGLSSAELAKLVEVNLRSGAVVDLSGVSARKVDKHSTGGVGDKVSIPLAPLVFSTASAPRAMLRIPDARARRGRQGQGQRQTPGYRWST